MIITKTPFRVSFVGGGSDIEDFYSHEQGAVLSTSINKYMYVLSHHFFDNDKIRVKYARTETVDNVNELRHPVVREVLKQFNITGALEISSNGDVPSGTGLASSSAFTVGLLYNIYSRMGKFVTKEQLAAEACEVEIERLGEPIGKQDQYACAFGGLNVITFNSNGTVGVEPIHLRRDTFKELQSNLLIFYTGQQRQASGILAEQKDNLKAQDKRDITKEMVKLVWKLRESLLKNRIDDMGPILHENWLLKRQLASKVTNSAIDEMYKRAMDNGATGGKLLGAGGGGFLLFYCPQKNQAHLRRVFADAREMPFKFDNEGTKVIYAADEYIKH